MCCGNFYSDIVKKWCICVNHILTKVKQIIASACIQISDMCKQTVVLAEKMANVSFCQQVRLRSLIFVFFACQHFCWQLQKVPRKVRNLRQKEEATQYIMHHISAIEGESPQIVFYQVGKLQHFSMKRKQKRHLIIDQLL